MKVIDKVLDNYYSYKLIETIKDEIKHKYFIDIRIKNNENGVWVEVKRQEYNDNQYEAVFGFYKRNAFANLIDVERVREKVSKNVESYLKRNGI